jgi:hypothetical protein
MSDQQIGKREEELIFLDPFTEAYERATGEALLLGSGPDPPDFIGTRGTGGKVAVEMTRIMRDPETAHWDDVLRRQEFMEAYDALDMIVNKLEVKENKRAKNYGSWADKTILVLQLMDCPLSTIMFALETLQDDFTSHGFVEVWLADYSDDAYGTVELYGLYPIGLWGYYERPFEKPYR